MQLTLLTVGKCRTSYLQEGAADYAKRITRYASLKQKELKEERVTRGTHIPVMLQKEGERILQALPQGSFVVALDPAGEPCTSESLARRISKLGLQGKSRIVFIIGGPFGLDPMVLARADWRLSLSPMTLPHEIARLILLEQIYRAFTILRGENYHK